MEAEASANPHRSTLPAHAILPYDFGFLHGRAGRSGPVIRIDWRCIDPATREGSELARCTRVDDWLTALRTCYGGDTSEEDSEAVRQGLPESL